jgi:hypothetical protein
MVARASPDWITKFFSSEAFDQLAKAEAEYVKRHKQLPPLYIFVCRAFATGCIQRTAKGTTASLLGIAEIFSKLPKPKQQFIKIVHHYIQNGLTFAVLRTGIHHAQDVIRSGWYYLGPAQVKQFFEPYNDIVSAPSAVEEDAVPNLKNALLQLKDIFADYCTSIRQRHISEPELKKLNIAKNIFSEWIACFQLEKYAPPIPPLSDFAEAKRSVFDCFKIYDWLNKKKFDVETPKLPIEIDDPSVTLQQFIEARKYLDLGLKKISDSSRTQLFFFVEKRSAFFEAISRKFLERSTENGQLVQLEKLDAVLKDATDFLRKIQDSNTMLLRELKLLHEILKSDELAKPDIYSDEMKIM